MDPILCLVCGPADGPPPRPAFCPKCGQPLFFAPSRDPRCLREGAGSTYERFIDFLPLSSFDGRWSLGEGNTPLLRLARVGKMIGLTDLYAKNEALNPTGSFKDRGTAVAIQKAVASGCRRIGTVSTGNMAASTAAYGARAGLETFVLVKDGAPAAALQAAAVHGPHLIMVEGDYGELFTRSLEIGRSLGISFMNSVDPYRVEGYKIEGFEIFLQLRRRAPRYVFVPLSSGGHLIGLMRAFEDLEREGLIRGFPVFVGVQAEGCAPLVQAFESGRTTFERLHEARTIAHAISNPAPPAGNSVLKLIRDRGGRLMAVSDQEMLAAQKELAVLEGLFCQPESATTLAAVKRLSERGEIGPGDEIVLLLTGSGLKTRQAPGPPTPIPRVSLAGLESIIRSLLGPQM